MCQCYLFQKWLSWSDAVSVHNNFFYVYVLFVGKPKKEEAAAAADPPPAEEENKGRFNPLNSK